MTDDKTLRSIAPGDLGQARAVAHKAAQFVTKAARANLAAAPDDSHSNLGWDAGGQRFLSQPIATGADAVHVSVSLSPLTLSLVRGGISVASLDLDGKTETDADRWIDENLVAAGLKPASAVTLPFELPADVAAVTAFRASGNADALATLSAWFDLAHGVLEDFTGRVSSLSPGPSPVRCWPHHFDIATYVGLETGDPETARGIGVGLSPGDESYDQPYVYINPWPHLKAERLPDLPPPGHWHTEGFVGAIATAENILILKDVSVGLSDYVATAFDVGRAA